MKALVKTISRTLNKEITSMCSDRILSVFRCKTESSVNFDFGAIIDIISILKELHSQAPILLSLLRGCLKTKKRRQNEDVMLGVIAGLICKHRRSSCSLIPSYNKWFPWSYMLDIQQSR